MHRHDGGLRTHSGQAAGDIAALFLDEGGSLLIETAQGIGLLDDRDLAGVLAECRDADGAPASEEALLALMQGEAGAVFWQNVRLQPLSAVDVPRRFIFNPDPRPGSV